MAAPALLAAPQAPGVATPAAVAIDGIAGHVPAPAGGKPAKRMI